MTTTLEDLRRERLAAHLDRLEIEIEQRTPVPPAEAAWLGCAKRSLEKARAAKEAKREQTAWTHLHSAFRFLLEGAPADEVQGRVKALRREAGDKLSGWRRAAILDLLEADAQKPPGSSEVALAQFLLDQHFDNVYFKLAALGTRLKQLNRGLMALSGLVLLACGWLFRESDRSPWLLGFLEGLQIMVLGAAGAALSHALTAIRGRQRIPEVIQGWYEQGLRLLIGALSAIAVVLIVQSGILPFLKVPAGRAIYVYALAAGLSEQLLSRVIRRIEAAVQE